ncbi:MAG TPA: hypothetical protein VIK91_26800 [Nannocystis sp.]
MPTQTSDTGTPQEGLCACVDPDEERFDAYDADGCGWGPCATIQASDDEVLDVKPLDCALDLLISGTPGVVHFEHEEYDGYNRYGGFVRVDADRRGLSRTSKQEDLGCSVGPFEIIELKPADYFADCKAMPDPWDRFVCLRDWKQAALGEACAEGYDCSSP